MSHRFWDTLPRPFFVLAPMADVTDVPFRTIVAQCGRPDVFYTEFVSAHGLNSPGRERLVKDLALTDSDHPIVAQFFGTKPEHLRAAGALARELGFDGVDINMGCPADPIMRQGAGVSLVRTPKLARELIAALREGAGDLPVAVKTRLGLYRTEEWERWIPAVLEAEPDVLIIHGRTMKEMSKVPAHWDLIGKVAAMCREAGVLCIGNGDVESRAQGEALAREYGVDGIMVGRGIFKNPWLFQKQESGERESRSHDKEERLNLLSRHLELWEAQWSGVKSLDLMKKFMKVYVSGWPGSAELRARLMQEKSAEGIRAAVREASA